LSNFVQKHDVAEASSVLVFIQRSTEPGGPLRLSYSHSMHTTKTVNFNICTWEQI